MTREESSATMVPMLGEPVRLSGEALAAKAMLVEHFRGRGGLLAALRQYRELHPALSLEGAILGLFAEICA